MHKIEKIKPRIREFIYDFNKQNFDRKTNTFIHFLLDKSFTQKEGTRKRILFPNNLPALKVKSLTVLPKFNVIPIRVISPKLPVKVTQRQIDLTKRKELVNKTSKWKHDKERIIYWTNVAFQELDEKSPLIFTPLFFKKIDQYAFLYEKKAKSVFAKLDYALRGGIHIQREYPADANLFRFLNENENFESLKNYYKDFFNLKLVKEGNEFNQYFYLDLNEDGKGNIPSDYRDYLKNEHIILGMLFLKMYKLDGNIELDSISEFTSLLYDEYEEEKNAIRKLVNDSSSDKGSDLNDQKFDEVIKKSFVKFGELGWLVWENEDEKNKFKIMPSFERLRNAYQPQIETIDNLIKEVKDAE